MVGQRRRELISSGSDNGYNSYNHLDLENGNGHHASSNSRFRFKDAVKATMANKEAQEMKKTLLESVDPKGLEEYRKSDEQVRVTLKTRPCVFGDPSETGSCLRDIVKSHQEQESSQVL